MEKDPTDEAQMLHNLAFNQLCAEYLDENSLALVGPLTQESITLLRDKVLGQLSLPSSLAKMFAFIGQWNAAQSISKLPPELISHITALRFPMADYFGESKEQEDLASSYMEGLASLATISRTWRNTIVETPSLWGLLSTDLPPHINKISFARSGSCQLMVGITPWTFRTNIHEVCDLALPAWNRWSHAWIWCPHLHRVMERISSPAPSLKTLHLDMDPDQAPDSGPISLFGGVAPRLQEISFYGTVLALGSKPLRDLRKLKLAAIEAGAISVNDILALLTASPRLESFHLLDSQVGLSPSSSPPTQEPIQLPNLKTVTLKNVDVVVVGHILPFIRLPNCQVFRLQPYSVSDDPFNPTEFLDRSLGHLDTFLRSTLDFHGSSRLSISCADIHWLCNPSWTLNARLFSINIPHIRMNSSIPWILQLLGRVHPAHRLSVLLEYIGDDTEGVAELENLALLPNIETLRLGLGTQTAELALGLLGSRNEAMIPSSFPGLEVLQLEHAYTRPFEAVKNMLSRRYGNPDREMTGARPIRIVLAGPFSGPPSPSGLTSLESDYSTRLHTLQGVESVKLLSRYDQRRLPSIYDNEFGEFCNP